MDIIARAFNVQPIDNLDDVLEGTIIQAICEDGQSHIGVYVQDNDGTPRLIPLNMEIPLGPGANRVRRVRRVIRPTK